MSNRICLAWRCLKHEHKPGWFFCLFHWRIVPMLWRGTVLNVIEHCEKRDAQ